jgi:hypothetical protein
MEEESRSLWEISEDGESPLTQLDSSGRNEGMNISEPLLKQRRV